VPGVSETRECCEDAGETTYDLTKGQPIWLERTWKEAEIEAMKALTGKRVESIRESHRPDND
jgi:hypothetical protein